MSKAGSRDGDCQNEGAVVYRSTGNDHDDTELSTSVLMALDSVPGYDMENSETVVFDHIDLDALDELFSQAQRTSHQQQVTFPVADYKVTATATGEITISRQSASND